MASAERYDAFELMKAFRTEETLGAALTLFVERPDYGFVWLAYVNDLPAGCVSVALGIDTQTGGVTATLHDFFVAPAARRSGLGSALLVTLEARLTHLEVRSIAVAATADPALRAFLAARGYTPATVVFTRHR